MKRPTQPMSRWALALAGACLVLSACEETTIVECEDQFGNPVNCTESSGSGTASDGTDGADGQSGSTGATGTDGVDGSTSSTATTGTDGTDGATGAVDGADGADGVSGPSCDGVCGSWLGETASCHCDAQCVGNDDCCADYQSLCGGSDSGDGTDGDDGSDGNDGGTGNYEFPAPFETHLLSYNDCRGIASGNSSFCETYDCRAIVKRDKGPCTTADCKGIASANYSWCDSAQCKGISRGYKCLDDHESCMDDAEDSSAKGACDDKLESCQIEASGYCSGHKACKAITRLDSSWCGSDDGNCKAIAKGDSTFCFYGDE